MRRLSMRAVDILAGIALIGMIVLLALGQDGEIKATFLVLVGYIIRAAVPLVINSGGGGSGR